MRLSSSLSRTQQVKTCRVAFLPPVRNSEVNTLPLYLDFYVLTQQPQYLDRILKYLNHENMYVRWAAVFDLGAVAHRQAVEAILTATVPSSLKLLNLKRILETVLDNDTPEEETSQLIFQAIDDLLMQL